MNCSLIKFTQWPPQSQMQHFQQFVYTSIQYTTLHVAKLLTTTAKYSNNV